MTTTFMGQQIERKGFLPDIDVSHLPGVLDHGAHDLFASGIT